MGSRVVRSIFLSMVVLLCFCPDAFAYLDPGSSSMLWQLLFSAAIGLCIVFRTVKERIGSGIARMLKIFHNRGKSSKSPNERP